LDAQTRAKNHYKEQFTKTLEELALLKKREEASARALLKKQQMELDHLRMRYLSGEGEITAKKSSQYNNDE
jgi:centrosomal protein CEP120